MTLQELGIKPTKVSERMVGASLPWIGILSIACLEQKNVARAEEHLCTENPGTVSLAIRGLTKDLCQDVPSSVPRVALSSLWY